MPGCCSTISYPPLIRRLGRRCNSNRRHSPIHILNDDVLLNIFHLYRLADPDEYDDGIMTLHFWHRQRWWYKLAHVCRLWRSIILESPSRLDLHLYCTNGVPVADMLAHSPPLPLTIDYTSYQSSYRELSAADESGILLALSHRDRVRRIGSLPDVARFVTAMDGQFPVLERMYIHSRIKVVFPATFQAPNLRHLSLDTASRLIGSPLLTTTAAGIVTLTLNHNTGSLTDVSHILTWLSLMAHLEGLSVQFLSLRSRGHDVERQLHQTSDMTTLPNLRRFVFRGMAIFLEDFVARISAPCLSILHISLFDHTVPHTSQLLQTSENLKFRAVQVTFRVFSISLRAVPWKCDTSLMLEIEGGRFDSQVAPAAQLFALSPVLSVVEQVAFSYEMDVPSLQWYSNVDRRQWRELLMPFTNAKTICVQDALIGKIFPSLPSDDGEPPLELLPNLEEVGYSGTSEFRDIITTFLDERQESGHPVRLRLVDGSMFNQALLP